MKYNAWDIDYLENKEQYDQIFQNSMHKEQEGDVSFLEENICKLTDRRYAVACASATDALHFSLICHNIGPGDEILVTNFSWISSASCISMVGATPVLCDINLDTYHVSLDSIKRMISEKTKGLIYTHLFGNMSADVFEIIEWCRDNNIAFIEDAAQSLGASLNGTMAGTLGETSSFSFNTNKVIAGTSGGGMFMTDNGEFAKKVAMLRRHGKDNDFSLLGRNSKMFVLNAEIINFRLQRWKQLQERRQAVAQMYSEQLSNINVFIQLPEPNQQHNYHKYVVRFEDQDTRDLVRRQLGATVHYDLPLSVNSMYNQIDHRKDDCGNSLVATQTVLSLPIHPWVEENEITEIIDVLEMLV